MATSSVDIANIALRILGEPPITSLTGTQTAQVLCAQALPFAKSEVFSHRPWSILIKRKTLSRLLEVENLTEYQYVYSQPADCIRFLAVRPSNTTGVTVETTYLNSDIEDSEPYFIEGGNIYTDVNNAYGTYIRNEENPSVLPSYLVEAVGASIAKRIAYALLQNGGIAQFATQNYYTALQFAASQDAQSQKNTVPPGKQWSKVF